LRASGAFQAVLDDALIRARVRGIRANASTLSHAELDEASELDEGDPADLAGRSTLARAWVLDPTTYDAER
jgi:hypothetical protein